LFFLILNNAKLFHHFQKKLKDVVNLILPRQPVIVTYHPYHHLLLKLVHYSSLDFNEGIIAASWGAAFYYRQLNQNI
jgi:hypothetical protein